MLKLVLSIAFRMYMIFKKMDEMFKSLSSDYITSYSFIKMFVKIFLIIF